MNSFRNHRLRDFLVPMNTNRLLNDLAEAKGKQELYTRQSSQVLKALCEMALVQSVESSNRIEGITVAPERLRPLVLGHPCWSFWSGAVSDRATNSALFCCKFIRTPLVALKSIRLKRHIWRFVLPLLDNTPF